MTFDLLSTVGITASAAVVVATPRRHLQHPDVTIRSVHATVLSHRKASNKRLGSKSMPTVPGVSRSVRGVPAFIDPRAGRAELAPQMNGARSKPRYTEILQISVERRTMIKTQPKVLYVD